MILRLYTLIKFIIWTPIIWIAKILALPLVPIAVLFADKDGRLPYYLRWLETHDDLGWMAGYYEPDIKKWYDNYGERIALIMWLWRNRAYTLGNYWRCSPNWNTARFKSYGTKEVFKNPNSWWLGTVRYDRKWFFEFSFAISVFGKFNIGLRSGWKLIPFFVMDREYLKAQDPDKMSAGSFNGISIRTTSKKDK